MREILFRGKRIDNGEWVESWSILFGTDETVHLLKKSPSENRGIENSFCEVDTFTVGQYTGLTDKNGKKIFEGDRVNRNGKQATVVFDESEFSLAIDGNQYIQHGLLVNLWKNDLEVIGNIYDNLELKEARE